MLWGLPSGWSVNGALLGGVFGGEAGVKESVPPWHPVGVGEAAALLEAHRVARATASRLLSALVAAGVERDEVPGLCGALDSDGRPVVALGRVSVQTAVRITDLLSDRAA